MSKRLDILGARIFGASVCHAPKYLQLFRKCPNVWTKSPDLAIMHKHKPYTSSTYTCICAFCYFINFLHTFLDIFTIFLFVFLIYGIAAPASSIPPVATLPDRLSSGRADCKIRFLTSISDRDASQEYSIAAVPVTIGAAIDVPLM